MLDWCWDPTLGKATWPFPSLGLKRKCTRWVPCSLFQAHRGIGSIYIPTMNPRDSGLSRCRERLWKSTWKSLRSVLSTLDLIFLTLLSATVLKRWIKDGIKVGAAFPSKIHRSDLLQIRSFLPQFGSELAAGSLGSGSDIAWTLDLMILAVFFNFDDSLVSHQQFPQGFWRDK